MLTRRYCPGVHDLTVAGQRQMRTRKILRSAAQLFLFTAKSQMGLRPQESLNAITSSPWLRREIVDALFLQNRATRFAISA